MASADSPGPSYTVLRIKRKATEPPLSSLVIQQSPDSRIKKRRAIIGSGAKGVFRLAETVPDTWQGEGEEGDVLRERIKGLLSKQPLKPTTPTKSTISPSPLSHTTTDTKTAGEPANSDFGPSRSNAVPTSVQYRVVPPPSPRSRIILPPKIMTYAEERAKTKALNFVDAEAVSAAGPSRMQTILSDQEEKDMASFLPMLEEYLSLESPAKGSSSTSRISASRHQTNDEEKYVYDLYYRDIRSGTSTPLGLGAGDGVNIGALLGYNDGSPTSTPSDSEPEDEADEDSNDEDYYRNDYPEDEDADEDMQGYRDAFGEDEGESDEGGSEGERGGTWDYR